jgi:hypothetical protein
MASVARRHQALTTEIARLGAALEQLVRPTAPQGFLAEPGVATQVASILVVTVGDNPGRVRREASFAAMRRQPGRCLFRQAAPPPAQPRRRPAGQLCVVANRHHPDGPRPPDPGLRSPADRRGQHQEGDHPLPQALCRPGGLPGLDPPGPGRHSRTRVAAHSGH